MSTQKRENRYLPATETCRLRLRFRWQRLIDTERAGGRGTIVPTPFARYSCAGSSGGTAPLISALWSLWVRLATKFLRADISIGQLVQPAFPAERTASPPPFGACCPLFWNGARGASVSPRSSLPHIPFPSGPACLHLTLPQSPAAYQRRAERYDGKRDLYFLHAA
jgi:hypothetical protein